jgi:hypothetical protein
MSESEVFEKLDQIDSMKISIAKLEKDRFLALAEKALAQSETAEAKYRCAVLEIFLKYGLSTADHILEDGTIKRNP